MNIQVEPWLVYNAQNVKQLLQRNPVLFAKRINQMREHVADAIDYKWSNTHWHMWSPHHRHLLPFSVTVDTHGTVSFYVWDINQRKVAQCSGPPDDNWKPLVAAAFRRVSAIDDGLYHCSDCDKGIEEDDIAGRYFAGIYCSACWENTWKAIEAKETYN